MGCCENINIAGFIIIFEGHFKNLKVHFSFVMTFSATTKLAKEIERNENNRRVLSLYSVVGIHSGVSTQPISHNIKHDWTTNCTCLGIEPRAANQAFNKKAVFYPLN